MKPDVYLGMRPGDLDGKRYARFWNPDMAPLPAHVADALAHGLEAPALGFGLDEADQLVEPGYLPLENGWTRLRSGEIFVAVRTDMPGVTGEMFEWWMGWHPQESERYKLWHPRAHVANRTQEMWADDPDRSDREKYMTTHYVTEYIGPALHKITINFCDPSRYFSAPERFAENGITATACATVGVQGTDVTTGRLIHQIREVDGGSEMRSRFWLGKPESPRIPKNPFVDRIVGSEFLFKRLVRQDLGRDMVVHCGMEMNHLATFLPALYAEYHD